MNSAVVTPLRYELLKEYLGFSELLFLDGHAGYQFTDTRRGARYRNVEWTLWFSEYLSYIPDMFKPPFPGIEEYECHEP